MSSFYNWVHRTHHTVRMRRCCHKGTKEVSRPTRLRGGKRGHREKGGAIGFTDIGGTSIHTTTASSQKIFVKADG